MLFGCCFGCCLGVVLDFKGGLWGLNIFVWGFLFVICIVLCRVGFLLLFLVVFYCFFFVCFLWVRVWLVVCGDGGGGCVVGGGGANEVPAPVSNQVITFKDIDDNPPGIYCPGHEGFQSRLRDLPRGREYSRRSIWRGVEDCC